MFVPIDVDVLEDNEETVDVFRSCQLTFAGMGGACVGLSATEADAAMRSHRVPPSRRREVLMGMLLMGRIQAHELNTAPKDTKK